MSNNNDIPQGSGLDSFMENWNKKNMKSKKKKKKPKKINKLTRAQKRDEKSIILVQSFYRMVCERRALKNKIKLHKVRTNIAKEILSTEETYVFILDAMVNKFMKPITELELLDNDEINVIFSNVEMILGLNTKLLEDLNDVISNKWSINQLIGPIFLEFAEFLKIYITFVNNYKLSLETLSNCINEIEELEQFCKKTMRGMKGYERDSIESFLITPVQRIPRYQLLLRDLLKRTWDDHPDKTNIEEALEKIKKTATIVNKKAVEAENMSKIINIQNKIVQGKSQVNILDASRRFIKDGILTQYVLGKKSKEVYCVLFNDLFVICKHEKKRWRNTQKWEYNHQIDFSKLNLDRSKVISIKDDPSRNIKNGIRLTIRYQNDNQSTTINLLASEDEEREEWIQSIKDAIKETTEKLGFIDKNKTKIAKERAKTTKALITEKYTSMRVEGNKGKKKKINYTTQNGVRKRNWSLNYKKMTAEEKLIYQDAAKQNLEAMLLEENNTKVKKEMKAREKANQAKNSISDLYNIKDKDRNLNSSEAAKVIENYNKNKNDTGTKKKKKRDWTLKKKYYNDSFEDDVDESEKRERLKNSINSYYIGNKEKKHADVQTIFSDNVVNQLSQELQDKMEEIDQNEEEDIQNGAPKPKMRSYANRKKVYNTIERNNLPQEENEQPSKVRSFAKKNEQYKGRTMSIDNSELQPSLTQNNSPLISPKKPSSGSPRNIFKKKANKSLKRKKDKPFQDL